MNWSIYAHFRRQHVKTMREMRKLIARAEPASRPKLVRILKRAQRNAKRWRESAL